MSPFLDFTVRSPNPPRPSRKLPEVEEQDAQGDSLDECYLTYSALPDLADLQGTSTRAGINSFDDMDNPSALEVASESSMVQLTSLLINPQANTLGLLSQPPLMLTGVTAVSEGGRHGDQSQALGYPFQQRPQLRNAPALCSSSQALLRASDTSWDIAIKADVTTHTPFCCLG